MPRPASGMRRRRDERGAIIPMMAMLLVVLIPSTAIAVDLGMQRVVRRDMQALADVVALAVAALRDKDIPRAKEILAGLTREFPQNPLYRQELARLQLPEGTGQ